MKAYLITPKAPLMFRDGRNFGADAIVAETLRFPRPSTLAGALRTAWAESQEQFQYDAMSKAELLEKSVQGPLLAEITETKPRILLPAPADSLCLGNPQTGKTIHRLKPEPVDPERAGSNFCNEKLQPVFLQGDDASKPAKDAPDFWYLEKFTAWLEDDHATPLPAKDQGINALPVEIRSHVAIDPITLTNRYSYLYQTAGIDFAERRQQNSDPGNKHGWEACHYGLLMRFSDELPECYRTIGGEMRLGFINKKEDLWPKCPDELTNKLKVARAFRLILVTPAIFKKGHLPDFIDAETLKGRLGNLNVQLKAAAVPRWQAGASWDMLNGSQGKGMRTLQRLAPAGSVYWFDIESGDASELNQVWLKSISSEPTENFNSRKKDGYGLAVPGIWTK